MIKWLFPQILKYLFWQESVADPKGEIEVLDPELLIKHPLQNKWSMWFFKNDKSKSWTENLRIITNFDTVEDFWA